MSLYIKGLEMPANCFDCPCIDVEFLECAAKEHLSLPKDEYGATLGDIPNWCPLVYMPDADVEPIRHGEWIPESPHVAFAEECSNCGGIVYWDDGYLHRYPFCPNCGAKMNVEE